MSQTGKIWFILNPAAGKGKAEKHIPKIKKSLENSGKNFELLLTTGIGHAFEMARDLPIDINDTTIAAGGDGTVNEVVNGLLTRPKNTIPPLFGILPIGRGNDFASTPRIPGNVDEALAIIYKSEAKTIDAGFVKGGFFPDGR